MHAASNDRRYYTVWKMPAPQSEGYIGIHASVGSAGYHAITQQAGGFNGRIKFKVFYTLEEALQHYVVEASGHGAPLRADFIGH